MLTGKTKRIIWNAAMDEFIRRD